MEAYVHKCLTSKHIHHAKLYLDEDDDILSKLISNEYSPKLERLFKKEEESKKVSMYDGIVNVVDIALYSRTKYNPSMDIEELNPVGLYIRLEQNKPDRRSMCDRGFAEIFIFDNCFLYIVASADENKYNVDTPGERYYAIYNQCCVEMGLKPVEPENKNYFTSSKSSEFKAYKIELRSYEDEFEHQVKDNNFTGIFKGKKRDELRGSLSKKYAKYSEIYNKYINKIKIVLKDHQKTKVDEKEKVKMLTK